MSRVPSFNVKYIIFGSPRVLMEASSWINIHSSDAELTQFSNVQSVSAVSTPRGGAGGAVPAGQEGTKTPSPSASLVAEVMAPDSEEKRAEQFQKVREIVASLTELNEKFKDQEAADESMMAKPVEAGDDGSPSGQTEQDDAPDFDPDDAPVVDEVEKSCQNSTVQEMARLVELLSEQRAFLEKMQRESEAREAAEEDKKLLEDIHGGKFAEARSKIEIMLPDQLVAVADTAGMTALHHAVRVGALSLVFLLLERAPVLATAVTKLDRNPPGWTALMVLANKPPAEYDPQMCAALVSHMDLDSLNVRSGTYATVSHLCVSRGNLAMFKKVMYRVNDLSGQKGCFSHLMLQNQMDTCQWKIVVLFDFYFLQAHNLECTLTRTLEQLLFFSFGPSSAHPCQAPPFRAAVC